MKIPKLVTVLQQGYSWNMFRADLIAGLIVGVVALPLAIAFAIASGVSPDKGLVTAIIAGFLISLLGGSRVQIGGPTGAFVIIVHSIIQQYGLEGLWAATLMAGMILIIFGLAGLGGVIKFIPRPVTIGFTSGIATIIFTSQIKDFFGMEIKHLPAEFFEKLIAYSQNMQNINLHALLIGGLTVGIILLWQHSIKKIPGAVVSLIITTVIVCYFKFPIATIGSTFGDIPHNLPAPVFPHITLGMIRQLMAPAFAIALLAGIESLLSAVVADGMTGGKHRSNMELIAQGIANIASVAFGGIPATGAIARTAVNVHNGGRTPIAGIVHALTLLLIMMLFSPAIKLVPLASLAGILMIVAYRMAEWHSFFSIMRSTRSDMIVLLATFILTVTVDLPTAIQIGMVLAAFLLIYRLSKTANIKSITKDMDDSEEEEDESSITKDDIPVGVEVFEVKGPFFFGMISTFLEAVEILEKPPVVRIIRMRHVLSMDETALHALRQTLSSCRKHNIELLLSGVHVQPLTVMERSGFLEEIGKEKVFTNINDALGTARDLLGKR